MNDLILRPLQPGDEAEAIAANSELAADGFSFLLGGWQPGSDWAGHLADHERWSRGENLPEGMVAGTFLVAEVAGQLVGRASIRHELNDFLAEIGGHVGYGVRPAFRRRGYATQILRRSLLICRRLGLDRVLVTCDDDNLASAATIERCGGIFERMATGPSNPQRPVPKRRYWIDLRPEA